MNNKYAMEFKQKIDRVEGLTASNVYLLEIESGKGRNRVINRIDLGVAFTEEEANKKVDDYLQSKK
ncbi:hypothetical protein CIL05_03230 [Virgibacillus profundi]|uniref:Uncharacterized protein n=1 Tax=Virgibacillus profundi TaxID=2024555 RepID=A0A2A2IG56_9BACI|nr:hypothetical protein [Virgibacillus profundi]PAV30749.1 hypothetical protein CIL05_03230 [Virgibacillus profundi]PXY54932.1 hypothetical protein CIT14_03305 [Virgibacillus profundi]